MFNFFIGSSPERLTKYSVQFRLLLLFVISLTIFGGQRANPTNGFPD
jgi:hypothetical protein